MLNIVDVTQYLYPDDLASGRIKFYKPDENILISQWSVDGVSQPTEQELLDYGVTHAREISISLLTQSCVVLIQNLLDSTAKSRNYYDAASCISYATSSNLIWQSEAKCFIAWRDNVWNTAYTIYTTLSGNDEPMPTVEEVIAELPAIVWPN